MQLILWTQVTLLSCSVLKRELLSCGDIKEKDQSFLNLGKQSVTTSPALCHGLTSSVVPQQVKVHMNKDIRLATLFRGYRKRKKLERLLGFGAEVYIIDIWLTAAENCPEGALTGWDEEGIADACNWEGEPKELVDALIKSRWLEKGKRRRPDYVKIGRKPMYELSAIRRFIDANRVKLGHNWGQSCTKP